MALSCFKISLVQQLESWNFALVQQVDHQVEDANYVVPAAGSLELELTFAGEEQVALEEVLFSLW